MRRTLTITLLILVSCKNPSGKESFESALQRLYFGVDVFAKPDSVLSSFQNIDFLRYEEPRVAQWDLNTSIFMNDDAEAWSQRHSFAFIRSPLSGLRIHSGEIALKIGETATAKKLMDLSWLIHFTTEDDAEAFYARLKEIFAPWSAKVQEGDDETGGRHTNYSISKDQGNAVRAISFYLAELEPASQYTISMEMDRH